MIFKLTPEVKQWLKSKDKAVSDVFDFQNDVPLRQIVAYLLNSSYRQSVTLTPWLEEMVETDTDASRTALEAIRKDFPYDPLDYDSVVLSVLKWAVMRFKYVSDKTVWKLDERWQTSEESLALMTGDCEDGAILMYVLCRKIGVPANQLMLFCGSVLGGGHCWLGYRPLDYPLNFVFLDWCYWSDTHSVLNRSLFYIQDKTIVEYTNQSDTYTSTKSNYYSIWFVFNSELSYLSFKRK
jgi:hypothetical protein